MVYFFLGVTLIGVTVFWLASNHWIARFLMFLPLASLGGILGALWFSAVEGAMPYGIGIGILAAIVVTWIPKWVREAKSHDASLELSLHNRP